MTIIRLYISIDKNFNLSKFLHDIIGNPIFVVIWCAVRDLDAPVTNIAKALKALNGLKHVSHNFLLE